MHAANPESIEQYRLPPVRGVAPLKGVGGRIGLTDQYQRLPQIVRREGIGRRMCFA